MEYKTIQCKSSCLLCIIVCLMFAIFIALVAIGGFLFCKDTCETEKDCLCTATSVVDFDDATTSVSVNIPENSAITKVYASIFDLDGGQQPATLIIDGSEMLFRTGILVDSANLVTNYELDLIHPLFVGDITAQATLTVGNAVDFMELTVMYCPNASLD